MSAAFCESWELPGSPELLGSATGSAGVPGCRSTRTELPLLRTVRWLSPATTSISSGGSAVRLVTVTGEAGDCGSGTNEVGFTEVLVATSVDFWATRRFDFAACAGWLAISGDRG